ncbi:MAG: DUF6868 family protein [Aeoliella sp.]
MNIETMREFLGWCTVINLGLLAFGLVKVLLIRDWATGIHAKMFGLDGASVRLAYFQFFVNYKIAVVVFNLGPYIALRIMSGS